MAGQCSESLAQMESSGEASGRPAKLLRKERVQLFLNVLQLVRIIKSTDQDHLDPVRERRFQLIGRRCLIRIRVVMLVFVHVDPFHLVHRMGFGSIKRKRQWAMSDVKLLAVDVEFRAIDETGQCVVAQHDQHDEKKTPLASNGIGKSAS